MNLGALPKTAIENNTTFCSLPLHFRFCPLQHFNAVQVFLAPLFYLFALSHLLDSQTVVSISCGNPPARDVDLFGRSRRVLMYVVSQIFFITHNIPMAPVQICSIVWDSLPEPTTAPLRDPFFLFHYAEKALQLLATSNCDHWLYAFILTYIVPGSLWLLFFCAVIVISFLLVHGYCIAIIFRIPVLQMGPGL